MVGRGRISGIGSVLKEWLGPVTTNRPTTKRTSKINHFGAECDHPAPMYVVSASGEDVIL